MSDKLAVYFFSGLKKQYKSPNYKYVTIRIYHDGTIRYITNLPNGHKCFDNEHDAAIHVDKLLIQKGKNPVNILKKKV
jgi:hypothetical protein